MPTKEEKEAAAQAKKGEAQAKKDAAEQVKRDAVAEKEAAKQAASQAMADAKAAAAAKKDQDAQGKKDAIGTKVVQFSFTFPILPTVYLYFQWHLLFWASTMEKLQIHLVISAQPSSVDVQYMHIHACTLVDLHMGGILFISLPVQRFRSFVVARKMEVGPYLLHRMAKCLALSIASS